MSVVGGGWLEDGRREASAQAESQLEDAVLLGPSPKHQREFPKTEWQLSPGFQFNSFSTNTLLDPRTSLPCEPCRKENTASSREVILPLSLVL